LSDLETFNSRSFLRGKVSKARGIYDGALANVIAQARNGGDSTPANRVKL
jgi:hypothetical protein